MEPCLAQIDQRLHLGFLFCLRRIASHAGVLRALQRLQLRKLVRTMPKHDVISLVWQVSSQPQPVDGLSASSLAAAVQSSRVVYLTLGCIPMFVTFVEKEQFCRSLPARRTLHVRNACCSISGCPTHSGTTTCVVSGFADFLLAPLSGTPLFALPAKHLAVTPDLYQDARRFQAQVTERPLSVP